MSYYVYILYSKKLDGYYVGSTENPESRLEQHNTSGFHTFTSKYRPWSLAAVFLAGSTRGEAMKMERFIKKQKSKQFIERLLGPDYVLEGKLAQLVRVPKPRD